MMKYRFLALAPLLLVCLNAHADVYKCVKSGKTTFSDTPCEMGTPPIQGAASASQQAGGDNAPKSIGIQTCSKEASARAPLNLQGRVEVASVSGGEMEAVSYAGTTIPARKFFVAARLVIQEGADTQTRNASFSCFTSEDGRRVLKDVTADTAEPRSSKTQAITAPPRDNGISDTPDKQKTKLPRNKALDDY